MTKSNESRLRKLWTREIGTLGNGDRVQIDGVTPAPPYKVGDIYHQHTISRYNQFDKEGNPLTLPAPHIKSPEQMQIEAQYFGKNRHQLPKKKATHKHGGQGTVRRSSKRKAFRPVLVEV